MSMNRSKHLLLSLLLAGLLGGAQAQALRPEIGKPLQAAGEMIRAQKYKEAAAKLKEAEAVANRTPAENVMIDRIRLSIASASGDVETALKTFDSLAASGKLQAGEQLKMLESLVIATYRAKDYKRSAQLGGRYLKEGGNTPQIRTLYVQSLYLSGDYAAVSKELAADFDADQKAGRTPSEDRLGMLANVQLKLNDNAGYVSTIEKLVTYYPKKQYWLDLIGRLRRKPGFSDRFMLDVYRLQLATGNLTSTADYMEMVQLALQAGCAGEAKTVIEQGFAAGALGKGTDADRHKRLKDLTDKRLAEEKAGYAEAEQTASAAKEGTALVSLGYALAMNGQAAKGIKLIEDGIAKGGLKRPEDAKLLLGLALAHAGQKAKAVQAVRGVKGTDGASDLARLWALQWGRG